MARRAGDRRAHRRRHAHPRSPPARRRGDASRRRRRPLGARRCPRPGARPAADDRRFARRAGVDGNVVCPLARGLDPRRGRRLRLQALDPAPARTGRGTGACAPMRRHRGRARRVRRRRPLQRSRRPRAAPRRGANGAGAARAGADPRESASAISSSGSPPATRPTSCRSAIAAPIIRCSSGRRAACS